tara:strand:+ start:1371 stop:2750 length:1380 start_codon:yes stop_codon:yes gene_type:complete
MLIKKGKIDYILLIFLFFPFAFIIGQAAVSLVFIYSLFLFIINLKKINFEIEKKDFFLLLFFFIIFLSSIWNYFSDHKLLSTILSSILFLKFLIPYYLIKSIKIDETFYNQLVNILFLSLIAFLFVAIDTAYQYNHPDKLDLFGYGTNVHNINRLTGPFGNDEAIPGSYLIKVCFVILIFLNFYLIEKFKNKQKKIILFLIPFLNVSYLIIIFVTGERIAFLMSLLAFILLFFLLNKSKKSLFFSGTVAAIFITIILIQNPYIKSRYEILGKFIFSKNYISADVEKKTEINQSEKRNKNSINFLNNQWGAHYLTAIEIFKDKFFIGSGIKGFRIDCSKNKYNNIKSLSFYKRCSTHPHNLYFELLAETGSLGFISILIFFILIIKTNLKNILILKKNKFNFEDQIIFSCYIAAFAVFISILWPIRSSGSFFSNFNGSTIWINIYWLLLFEKYFKKNNMI